jgi:class 3 adenylate cyclase
MKRHQNGQWEESDQQSVDDDRSTLSSEQPTCPQGRKWLQSSWDLLLESSDGSLSRRIPVCYSHLTIGTRFGPKSNDIDFDEPNMGNRQAILKLIDDNLFFNSLNPAFEVTLNGAPCSFAQLNSNDVLAFGSHTITVLDLPTSVAFLEGYSKPHRRQQWTLNATRTPIGRAGLRYNVVELLDPTVSRNHATIIHAEGHYVIQPDGERKVYVNGEPVGTMAILGDEDMVQVGDQLLRFRTYRAKSKPRALLPREATILFSDIWNYTSLAESRPLEETIGQLNEVYKKLGRVIINNQGTLMTYLGDAMMAVFGADDDLDTCPDNHAELAVCAGLGMLKALNELNAEWKERGYPQLQIGIGVATGEVMLGDVGVTGHREFAAMGDTTNVASRIEKLTRQNGVHLLVNEETARRATDAFTMRDMGTVELKGRRKPVSLFHVVGPVG